MTPEQAKIHADQITDLLAVESNLDIYFCATTIRELKEARQKLLAIANTEQAS